MELSKEQQQEYLHNPNFCPVCRHNTISLEGGYEGDGNQIWTTGRCGNCEAEWTETYTLNNISNVTTKVERQAELDLLFGETAENLGVCPKCHQSFPAHNDDGSCVQD